jgi:hypothetical protein
MLKLRKIKLRETLQKLKRKDLPPEVSSRSNQLRNIPLTLVPQESPQEHLLQTPTPAIVRTKPYGLFLLSSNELPDVSKDLIGVDIVAIHGLNGDAYTTWQHENGVLWLRDLLPSSIPGSRVFTYGYPSELCWSNSVATLRDYSRNLLSSLNAVSEAKQRPIIFVCHSLGGIVCKQVRNPTISCSGDNNLP